MLYLEPASVGIISKQPAKSLTEGVKFKKLNDFDNKGVQ